MAHGVSRTREASLISEGRHAEADVIAQRAKRPLNEMGVGCSTHPITLARPYFRSKRPPLGGLFKWHMVSAELAKRKNKTLRH